MKKKLLALMLLAGGSAFAATHFSVRVGFGAPAYPVAPVMAAQPPAPGPGYVWIDGYYGPDGVFVPGYWALPPFADGYWIAPQFVGGRFVAGYWGHRDFDRGFNRGAVRDDFRGGFNAGFHAPAAPARADFNREHEDNRAPVNRAQVSRVQVNRGNDAHGSDRGFRR